MPAALQYVLVQFATASAGTVPPVGITAMDATPPASVTATKFQPDPESAVVDVARVSIRGPTAKPELAF